MNVLSDKRELRMIVILIFKCLFIVDIYIFSFIARIDQSILDYNRDYDTVRITPCHREEKH